MLQTLFTYSCLLWKLTKYNPTINSCLRLGRERTRYDVCFKSMRPDHIPCQVTLRCPEQHTTNICSQTNICSCSNLIYMHLYGITEMTLQRITNTLQDYVVMINSPQNFPIKAHQWGKYPKTQLFLLGNGNTYKIGTIHSSHAYCTLLVCTARCKPHAQHIRATIDMETYLGARESSPRRPSSLLKSCSGDQWSCTAQRPRLVGVN